jgi:GR25 family glycosyltransferase involved in LPS biosynthesis
MLKAYCINLDRTPENFKEVTKEFQGILDIERVSAIDGKSQGISGALALFHTQINLFEKLIQTNDKYAIVIEDDIYKLPKFNNYWPQIVNFISTASGWDFVSLDFFLSIDKPSLTVYNNFLYKTSAFRATGFIIYNIDFLKKNLDSIRHTLPLDLTMTFNKDYIKLIPKEVIVRQHVKKQSETNSRAKTSYYYSVYYRQTEEYLRNYGNDKLSLIRKFSLLRR